MQILAVSKCAPEHRSGGPGTAPHAAQAARAPRCASTPHQNDIERTAMKTRARESDDGDTRVRERENDDGDKREIESKRATEKARERERHTIEQRY